MAFTDDEQLLLFYLDERDRATVSEYDADDPAREFKPDGIARAQIAAESLKAQGLVTQTGNYLHITPEGRKAAKGIRDAPA